MSKILLATCDATGKVTVEGKVIEAAVLSEGNKASSGIVILEGANAFYVASSATDIGEVIEALVAIVNKIALTLTSIGTGMTGPTTAPPGTLPVDVAEIQTLKTQLNTKKDQLK